ncbi:MAG: cytochrome-c oxidase, cbb3-type subunit III [Pseudomonadota bacterium]
MASFWHWFIAAGTVLFTLWCIWLVHWSSKQGPTLKADEDLVGHTWDGDLEEWNNPAPRWWKYLYFITIAFALYYMVAYPGLGSFDGVLGWSQYDQYEEEMAAANARYTPIYEKFAAMPFDELKTNGEAHSLGGSLYASYCTTCHGSDARGAAGFPNLTDADWQWGNSELALTMTLRNGRNGIMPALGSALGGSDGVDNMVSYVRTLSGLEQRTVNAASAQSQFEALCGACHGADGKGNQMLGAPNLTDEVWLYGSGAEAIRVTIMQGRNGMMPAHGNLLGEARLRILAAYVAGLPERQVP